jgi:hypothetical protein
LEVWEEVFDWALLRRLRLALLETVLPRREEFETEDIELLREMLWRSYCGTVKEIKSFTGGRRGDTEGIEGDVVRGEGLE